MLCKFRWSRPKEGDALDHYKNRGVLVREKTPQIVEKKNNKPHRAFLYTQIEGPELHKAICRNIEKDVKNILSWIDNTIPPLHDRIVGRLATMQELRYLLQKEMTNYQTLDAIDYTIENTKSLNQELLEKLIDYRSIKSTVSLKDILDSSYHAIYSTGWYFGVHPDDIEKRRIEKITKKGDFSHGYYLLHDEFYGSEHTSKPGRYIIRKGSKYIAILKKI